MKIALALITRNEIQGLRAIFDRIPREAVHEVFAVDGHSTDGTVEFLRERGVPVHAQKEKGLGAAMLEARAVCRSDAIIFFHPDGNEEPADIPRLAARLEGGCEFVVASRMIPGARNEEDDRLIRPRKWANQGLALAANVLFSRGGVRSTDITNGLRGITCAAFDRMLLTSRDLTMDFQMVIRALKLGMHIEEFPTCEGLRIGGSTNFPSWQTGLKEVGLIWSELVAGSSVFAASAQRGEPEA